MSSDDIHAAHRPTQVSTPSDSKIDIAPDRKQVELAHLEQAVVNKETHFVVGQHHRQYKRHTDGAG